MGVSETVLAAMIGAGATLFTALFQLITSLRASSGDRRSKRGRFRSFIWMLALMLAAGVGGFAYAEYRAQTSRDETRAVRDELQQQMQALAASSARLELLRIGGAVANPERSAGADGSAATVSLPPCKGAQVGFATERARCSEQDALQLGVCAPVPATARVTSVELYTRLEDSQQPWAEARVSPGQQVAAGRFVDSHFERPDTESS